MIYLALLFALLYSFVRGICEGIVFYFPNPRNHIWFRWYHPLRIMEAIALITATISASKVNYAASDIWFVLGAVFLIWELFELGYKLARKEQVEGHENVLGIISLDNIRLVHILHFTRCAIGLLSLIIWRAV